ncbi:MAG: hypothetical protein HFF81_07275, partial [Oscillospiraceae bacterium]|nr:hypothetical protein [Oscillospiraceae bacterium]
RVAFAKAEALTMVCMKNRFWTLIARRSKLHIACSDFFKSQSALIALLLLSKSNPLRRASIWFWVQSRKKIDLTHLLQHVLIKICTAKTPHENAVFLCQYEKAEKIYAGKLKSKICPRFFKITKVNLKQVIPL